MDVYVSRMRFVYLLDRLNHRFEMGCVKADVGEEL